MIRILQKTEAGQRLYQTPEGTWTPDKTIAKEYKGQFWIELVKILIDLIKILGLTNIKFVRK